MNTTSPYLLRWCFQVDYAGVLLWIILLAAQTARQPLGVIMFLVSDYFLCMLGGIPGIHLVRLIYPSKTMESWSRRRWAAHLLLREE
jgi:hypothetical protein